MGGKAEWKDDPFDELEELKEEMEKAEGQKVGVHFSTEKQNTKALVHEFGSPQQGIPSRPFIRRSVYFDNYTDTLGDQLKESDIRFDEIGEQMVDDIRQGIRDQGLIDTGKMLASVDYSIED
jgi:hypothetical protein